MVHGFQADGVELGFESEMADAAFELEHFELGVGQHGGEEVRRQFERVQALVAAGFAQAHQVVVFQGVSSGENCTRTSYRTLPHSRRRRIRRIGPYSPRILIWH